MILACQLLTSTSRMLQTSWNQKTSRLMAGSSISTAKALGGASSRIVAYGGRRKTLEGFPARSQELQKWPGVKGFPFGGRIQRPRILAARVTAFEQGAVLARRPTIGVRITNLVRGVGEKESRLACPAPASRSPPRATCGGGQRAGSADLSRLSRRGPPG